VKDEEEKSECNSHIHPSYTYQLDHGEEGIETSPQRRIEMEEKNRQITNYTEDNHHRGGNSPMES